MDEYVYALELQHHGIKGMRWGIRRFQNKDGTLTPAGRKRYDDSSDSNKSTHRSRLEEKYRQSGMTPKEAAAAADKRIRTEKVIAATVGLTVAAAATYVVTKNVRERADKVIKAGTKLQVIANDPNKNLDRAFYTAYKDSDKAKYKGIFGKQLTQFGGEAHKITLDTTSGIKVASRQKAADAFADLYKNDSDFREAFKRNNLMMDSGGKVPVRDRIIRKAGKELTDKQLKRAGYDAFNIGLANHSPDGNSIAKKFYDKLKDQGYDAIMDINDQKYSGYKSKAPVIIFNTANKMSVSDTTKMSANQIASNLDKVRSRAQLEALAKEATVYLGAGAAVKYASTTLSDIDTTSSTTKKQKR